MAAPVFFPPEPLKSAADDVAALLKSRHETISVAETAAGGLISAALLATPGASAFYKGGLTVRFLVFFPSIPPVFSFSPFPLYAGGGRERFYSSSVVVGRVSAVMT